MIIGATKLDGALSETDFDVIKQAKLNGLFLRTGSKNIDGMHCVFEHESKLTNIKDFVISPNIIKTYESGGRYIIPHISPNTSAKGLCWKWNTPKEFSAWFCDVAAELRKTYPGIRIGYPALELGEQIIRMRSSAHLFMEQGRDAIASADFIATRESWSSSPTKFYDMFASLYHVDYLSSTYKLPIEVVFSNRNNNVKKGSKAEQYHYFYRALSQIANVHGGYCHTLSSSDHEDRWIVWHSDKKISVIPGVVSGLSCEYRCS